MQIKSFYDSLTATVTYVVSDPSTKHCAIIDSVHNYDQFSGRITTTSADLVQQYITENKLHVEWILDTHIHADHLTASSYLKQRVGGKLGIGEHIKDVLDYWIPLFNTASDTPADGSQFDVLFADNATFNIGNLQVTVIHTPGHTPACVSYIINDAVFVGDALFMPYVGTARTDFPGGSAETLYHSLHKILSLPGNTRVFTCHDYPPEGKEPAWESTVALQKKNNIMINDTVSKEQFIVARQKKDSLLAVPKLLLPSLQYNLRAGKLGAAENNQTHYMKIPVNKV